MQDYEIIQYCISRNKLHVHPYFFKYIKNFNCPHDLFQNPKRSFHWINFITTPRQKILWETEFTFITIKKKSCNSDGEKKGYLAMWRTRKLAGNYFSTAPFGLSHCHLWALTCGHMTSSVLAPSLVFIVFLAQC